MRAGAALALALPFVAAAPALPGRAEQPCDPTSNVMPVFSCEKAYLPRPTEAQEVDGADQRPRIEELLDAGNRFADQEFGLRRRKLELQEKALASGEDEDLEAWLQAIDEHRDAVTRRDQLYDQALSLTIRTYNLQPPTLDPRAAAGGRPNPVVAWKPRYSDLEIRDSRTGEWRQKSSEEAEEEKLDAARRGDTIFGYKTGETTTRNGKIRLFRSAFASPERLALAVYHETLHWVYVIKEEGRGHYHVLPSIEYQRHYEIYINEAEFARKVGVPDDDVRFFRTAAHMYLRQMATVLNKRLTWDTILTDPDCQFWAQRLPDEHGELPSDAALPPPFRSASSVVTRIAALAEAAEQGLTAWLGLHEGQVAEDRYEQGWDDFLARSAAACGFTRAGDQRTYAIDPAWKCPVVLRFTDDKQALAGFLVAGACACPDAEEPCVKGLATLDDNWSDPAFRSSLLLGVGSGEYMLRCVKAFVERYEPRGKFKAVRKIVASFDEV